MAPHFTHLLAKSTPDPERPNQGTTLLDHTREAVQAACAITQASNEWIARALNLTELAWTEQLARATALAAFVHDLGKANDHFQRLLRRRQGPPSIQAYRHELLSLWLGGIGGPLAEWLFAGATDLVRAAVLCAVAGHHLKFVSGDMPYADQAPFPLYLLSDHPEFAQTLSLGEGLLGLDAAPGVPPTAFDPSDQPLAEACRPTLTHLICQLHQRASREERRFIGAVKALVVSADVIASAVRRDGRLAAEAGAWIASTLSTVCTADDLAPVIEGGLKGKEPRRFQRQTAASEAPITLVRAGCGSGKTVAAYMWAKRWSEGRKLFVCYPTTGTATEGYADYLFAHEVESLLAHSRAEVDLERLRSELEPQPDVEDVLETREGDTREQAEQWAALERALHLWQAKIVACTADTVLGLLQNYRSGLAGFAAIASGAFVFDEIHLYDDRLFAALLRFLDEFQGAPALLMTASLQPHRLSQLHRVASRRGGSLLEIAGPRELEDGKRYELQLASAEEATKAALRVLSQGGKVLWVCNTVDAAIAAAMRLEHAGGKPMVYHSRFRYEDRARRHREVMDAFKAPGPVLAVTTQVCEVSLDLSADLLVSHAATIPAMIQRLGRLNRRFDPECPETRPALFYEPESHQPYRAADLEAGRRWLAQLGCRPVSQRDLADAFLQLAMAPEATTTQQQAWLDALPFAPIAPLRETESTIPIVLPQEARACRDAGGRPRLTEIVRRSIPMPLGPVEKELGTWKRVGMAFVPPPGRVAYSPESGARWQGRG